MKKLSKISVVAVFGLLPSVAFSVDGVVEISETCAVQLGCFGGDSPGYPVTIDGSAGSSYRLTSSLVIPDTNTHGIEVTAPDTEIDLNGFQIIGVGCVAATTDCSPATGSGHGVQVQSTSTSGVSVSNGSVVGMGSFGVRLNGDQSRAQDLRLRWNRSDGLRTGTGSVVQGVIASGNGGDGMQLGNANTVRNNVAFGNGDSGIRAAGSSSVIGNSAYNNVGAGISVSGGSVVRDNAAQSNGGDGIRITSSLGAVVANNSSTQNGGDGIFAFGSSAIQNNNVASNTGVGLNLTGTDAYSGNVITFNANPQVTGGVDLGGNLCPSPLCP